MSRSAVLIVFLAVIALVLLEQGKCKNIDCIVDRIHENEWFYLQRQL